MARYYLRDSTPVETWSEIPVEDLQRYVADTKLEDNGVAITTVFTGFNVGTDDDPKIFETLIHGGYHDGERLTYFTEQEALKGHDRIVSKASETLPNDVKKLGDMIASIGETNAYKLAQGLIEKGNITFNE